MKITNTSPFVAGWTVGFRPDGREIAVIAVKGTFDLETPNGATEPTIAVKQEPLIESDVFGPDPAYDAPVYENDFGHFKPECDVLLNAQAYAPQGRPSTRVNVAVIVGDCRKVISVVGERRWYKASRTFGITSATPFVRQPISYDLAFGGTDVHPAEPTRIETFVKNPVGTGYCRFSQNLDGMPLPTTEEPGTVVSDPEGDYRPMAFGPIGRNWEPRFRYAGTYDQRWQTEKLPYLPDDFDYHYFQAAPQDQRIPYPHGGEPIVLANLTPGGRLESSIPRESVWITVLRSRDRSLEVQAQMDTLLIEPDKGHLSVTWRVNCPLDRDPFEIREIVVERGVDRIPARSRARIQGKPYYKGLGEAVQSRRGAS